MMIGAEAGEEPKSIEDGVIIHVGKASAVMIAAGGVVTRVAVLALLQS
jgi:hypothetical protein